MASPIQIPINVQIQGMQAVMAQVNQLRQALATLGGGAGGANGQAINIPITFNLQGMQGLQQQIRQLQQRIQAAFGSAAGGGLNLTIPISLTLPSAQALQAQVRALAAALAQALNVQQFLGLTNQARIFGSQIAVVTAQVNALAAAMQGVQWPSNLPFPWPTPPPNPNPPPPPPNPNPPPLPGGGGGGARTLRQLTGAGVVGQAARLIAGLISGGITAVGSTTGGLIGGGLGALAGGAIGSVIPGVGTLAGGGLGFLAGSIIGKATGGVMDEEVVRALRVYEIRSRGILQVGAMLGGQYEGLGENLDELRKRYQVLTSEGVAAMTALARSTGRVRQETLMASTVFARASGMTPEAAAALAGGMERMGGGVPANLAAVSLMHRQLRAAGLTPMLRGEFAEEVQAVGAAGGLDVPPMTSEFSAGMTGFFAGVGGPGSRYGAMPAQAATSFMQRMAQPTTAPFQQMRELAVERIRRRGRPVTFGGKQLDLNDWGDFQILVQGIGRSPEAMAELFQITQERAGGNRSLARQMFIGAFDAPNQWRGRLEFERFETAAQRPGGIQAEIERPRTPAELQQEEARLKQEALEQGKQPEAVFQRMEALREAFGNNVEVMKTLTAAQEIYAQKVANFAEKGGGLDEFIAKIRDAAMEIENFGHRAANALGGGPMNAPPAPGTPFDWVQQFLTNLSGFIPGVSGMAPGAPAALPATNPATRQPQRTGP